MDGKSPLRRLVVLLLVIATISANDDHLQNEIHRRQEYYYNPRYEDIYLENGANNYEGDESDEASYAPEEANYESKRNPDPDNLLLQYLEDNPVYDSNYDAVNKRISSYFRERQADNTDRKRVNLEEMLLNKIDNNGEISQDERHIENLCNRYRLYFPNLSDEISRICAPMEIKKRSFSDYYANLGWDSVGMKKRSHSSYGRRELLNYLMNQDGQSYEPIDSYESGRYYNSPNREKRFPVSKRSSQYYYLPEFQRSDVFRQSDSLHQPQMSHQLDVSHQTEMLHQPEMFHQQETFRQSDMKPHQMKRSSPGKPLKTDPKVVKDLKNIFSAKKAKEERTKAEMQKAQMQKSKMDKLKMHSGITHSGKAYAGEMRSGEVHSEEMHPRKIHSREVHSGDAHSGEAHSGVANSGVAHSGVAHSGVAHSGVAHSGVAHSGVAHSGDAHSSDAHSRDAHYGDSHYGDAHSRAAHSRDAHSRDTHSRVAHSKDAHSRDVDSKAAHSEEALSEEKHSGVNSGEDNSKEAQSSEDLSKETHKSKKENRKFQTENQEFQSENQESQSENQESQSENQVSQSENQEVLSENLESQSKNENPLKSKSIPTAHHDVDKKFRSHSESAEGVLRFSAQEPLQIQKKSIRWSDYFGIDRRKKSSDDMDNEWMIERYHKAIAMANKKRSESQEKDDNDSHDMEDKIRNVEEGIVDETLKYTGAHEDVEDPKEIQEVKNNIISRLVAAYNLEKMRRALEEYRMSVVREKNRLNEAEKFEAYPVEEKRVSVPRKSAVDEDREKGDEDNNIKCAQAIEDCDEQNYKPPGDVFKNTKWDVEECPKVQRACNEAASVLGPNARIFEEACNIHQMCLLCGDNSWFAPTRQCNTLFIAKANELCDGDVDCQNLARHSVRYLVDVNRSLRSEPYSQCELACPRKRR